MLGPISVPSPFRPPLNNLDLVEDAAYRVSNDWAVFATHGTYVRPLRSWDFYHGEPCRLHSRASGKGIEIPPGAVYRYNSAMGHSATSWDPFLFPNPPRTFLLNQTVEHPTPYGRNCQDYFLPRGVVPKSLLQRGLTGHPESMLRESGETQYNRLRRFRRRVGISELAPAYTPPVQLDDLERQLWMDPEPRLERPFRMYADTKYCTKGYRLIDVAQLMRPGW